MFGLRDPWNVAANISLGRHGPIIRSPYRRTPMLAQSRDDGYRISTASRIVAW